MSPQPVPQRLPSSSGPFGLWPPNLQTLLDSHGHSQPSPSLSRQPDLSSPSPAQAVLSYSPQTFHLYSQLPDEVQCMILKEAYSTLVAQEHASRGDLASFACTNYRCKQLVEADNFKTLKLRWQDLRRFESLCVGQRRSAVRSIHFDIDPFSLPDDAWVKDIRGQRDVAYTVAKLFLDLFNVMKNWDASSRADNELIELTWTIVGPGPPWKTECLSCRFDLMPFPEVPVIGEIDSIPAQFGLHPYSVVFLTQKFPRLHSAGFNLWAHVCNGQSILEAGAAITRLSSLDIQLKKLTLECHPRYYNTSWLANGMIRRHYSSLTSSVLHALLRMPSLEVLYLDFVLDVERFLDTIPYGTCPSHEVTSPIWPRLREFRVRGFVNKCLAEFPWQRDHLTIASARILQHMPGVKDFNLLALAPQRPSHDPLDWAEADEAFGLSLLVVDEPAAAGGTARGQQHAFVTTLFYTPPLHVNDRLRTSVRQHTGFESEGSTCSF